MSSIDELTVQDKECLSAALYEDFHEEFGDFETWRKKHGPTASFQQYFYEQSKYVSEKRTKYYHNLKGARKKISDYLRSQEESKKEEPKKQKRRFLRKD